MPNDPDTHKVLGTGVPNDPQNIISSCIYACVFVPMQAGRSCRAACVVLFYNIYIQQYYTEVLDAHSTLLCSTCVMFTEHDKVFAPKPICAKCVRVPTKNEYGGCAPKPICAKCVRVQKTKYGGCAPKPMCAKCVRVPKKTNMEAVTPNRGAKSV